MKNFPLSRLEFDNEDVTDEYVYDLLKKIYSGKISFAIESYPYTGLLVRRVAVYHNNADEYTIIFDIEEVNE